LPVVKRHPSPSEQEALIRLLLSRFESHRDRLPEVEWPKVLARLESHPQKLWSLFEMERTGGEPAVVRLDRATGECLFVDCAAETPKGRRSLCYDEAALKARKEHKPAGSALELAGRMGVQMLDEAQYLEYQKFMGPFDTKTSSWVLTAPEMRRLGGALFGDHRFGRVFFYHNGAESYYSSRGFRSLLRV
jgi:hypothetical protein